MPGFYITNCKPVKLQKNENAPCIIEEMQIDEYYVCRNTREQFLEDKLFCQDEEHAVILESVIFNKKELMETYGESTLLGLVKKMMLEAPETFYDAFRGMFAGAVYDKKKKKWIVFSDHIGNKLVLYYIKNGNLIIGSQLNYIADTMRANNIERKLDKNAAHQFFDFGCFMDDSSWIADVKRVLPSDYIKCDKETFSVQTYHYFAELGTQEFSDEEAIEQLDRAFCQAVKRGLDKNLEYGYTSLIDISGGGDSRMVAYTTKRLGNNNELLVHYSQSGSNEMAVAKEIAKDLDMDIYVNALDDAEFMKDATSLISMNSGTAFYYGITGGKRVLQSLLECNPGVEFTGLLGDIMEGAMLPTDGECAPSITYGRFATSAIVPVENLSISIMNRFKSNNMFWLYTRGMLCGMSTFFTRQNFVEPYTPFGDVDFLHTIQSIPYKRLVEDHIQIKWMAKKYPSAVNIMYATSGCPIKVELSPFAHVIKKLYVLKNVIRTKVTGFSKTNMNPIMQWENEKPWLREWTQEFYKERICLLKNKNCIDEETIKQVDQLYNYGLLSKYHAITVVEACNQFLL